MRDREGSRETFEVSENPGRDRQGVGGVVESLRVTDTPVVEEFPRGDETSGVTLEGDRVTRADGQGEIPSHPRHQGERQHQPRRGDGKQAGSGGAAHPTAWHIRGQESRGKHAQAYLCHRRRQARVWRSSAP